MKVKIKLMSEHAKRPTYATPGSACFDLYAAESVTIPPQTSESIRLDLRFEVPVGYVMNVFSRSGHGFLSNVRLSNCTGKIDSDYRGSVKVSLFNDGAKPFIVRQGDRIAQAEIVPVHQVEFEEVFSLSQTARGEGGFGSTGE